MKAKKKLNCSKLKISATKCPSNVFSKNLLERESAWRYLLREICEIRTSKKHSWNLMQFDENYCIRICFHTNLEKRKNVLTISRKYSKMSKGERDCQSDRSRQKLSKRKCIAKIAVDLTGRWKNGNLERGGKGFHLTRTWVWNRRPNYLPDGVCRLLNPAALNVQNRKRHTRTREPLFSRLWSSREHSYKSVYARFP